MAEEGNQSSSNISSPRKHLFENVVYYINPLMGKDLTEELSNALDTHGAERAFTTYRHESVSSTPTAPPEINPLSVIPPRFVMTRTTHIISHDLDFPEYKEAMRMGKDIVTPAWVQISVRNNFLYHPEYFSPSPEKILSGIIVTISGLPDPDRESIVAALRLYGGQYRHDLTADVTHLICLAPSGSKYSMAIEKKMICVLPHWLEDCLRLGRRVPEKPYEFPDPGTLRSEYHSDLFHANVAIPSSYSQPFYFKTSPSLSNPLPEPPLALLQGLRFYLSKDLELPKAVLNNFIQMIGVAGGTVIQGHYHTDQVDVYVGKWRNTKDCKKACKDGKVVASTSWLYTIFHTGRIESPKATLLNFPLPLNGINGMQDMKITLSNYTGEAREYLKRLINATGATYTPDMSTENTHLICAMLTGEKWSKASQWSIHVVNHLWIEECIQNCKLMLVSEPRYTTWPPGVNLVQLVGPAPVLIDKVETWEGPSANSNNEVDKEEREEKVGGSSEILVSIKTEEGTTSPVEEKREEELDLDLKIETADEERAINEMIKDENKNWQFLSKEAITCAGDETENEVDKSVMNQIELRADQVEISHRLSLDENLTLPLPAEIIANINTPPTVGEITGSIVVEDIIPAKSETPSPGITKPHKRSHADQEENGTENDWPRKRSTSAALNHEERNKPDQDVEQKASDTEDPMDLDTDAGEISNVTNTPRLGAYKRSGRLSGKKATSVRETTPSTTSRRSRMHSYNLESPSKSAVHINLLTTGIKLTPSEQRQLKALGIKLVQSVSRDMTHLIAEHIGRTEKFLCAVSCARFVLSRDWIDDCISQHSIVDEKNYWLRDLEAEKTYGIKSIQAVMRDRPLKGCLDGISVFCTLHTEPALPVMKHIVECAGGKLLNNITQRRLRDGQDGLIVCSCEEDKSRWPEFTASGIKVWDSELILTGLLKQRIDLKSKEYLLAE